MNPKSGSIVGCILDSWSGSGLQREVVLYLGGRDRFQFFPMSCTTRFRICTVQICLELKFCAATYGPLWTLRPFEHSPLPNSSKFERKVFRSFKSMGASPASSDDWRISVYMYIACICLYLSACINLPHSQNFLLQYLYLKLRVQNHWFSKG